MLTPYFDKNRIEAGCDEAGRGCLAGPVFAAAVIIPPDFSHPLLNDSKLTTLEDRLELRNYIEEKAIAYSVKQVSPAEIDEINILWASIRAMHRALDDLPVTPEQLLIDGNRFMPYRDIPFHCMIKGDGRFASIAAASILAKTYRDDYMIELHEKYPVYNWQSNKGYPTLEHRRAIFKHGPCVEHRQSFRLLPDEKQGELFAE